MFSNGHGSKGPSFLAELFLLPSQRVFTSLEILTTSPLITVYKTTPKKVSHPPSELISNSVFMLMEGDEYSLAFASGSYFSWELEQDWENLKTVPCRVSFFVCCLGTTWSLTLERHRDRQKEREETETNREERVPIHQFTAPVPVMAGGLGWVWS